VETYLGSLPDLDREESWVDLGIDPPTGVIQKEVRKGVEPQSQTRIIFTGPFDYTPENRVGIRILASVLDTRLREVVREEMSGTYGVNVGRSYRLFPEPGYSIQISFGSDPERVDELVNAIFSEIENLQENGPAAEAVQAAKEQERRTKETNLEQNGWWATQLRFAFEQGSDPRLLVDDSFLDGVTPETVHAGARLWLRLDNYVQVSLFPEGTR
jgi:zinc protease